MVHRKLCPTVTGRAFCFYQLQQRSLKPDANPQPNAYTKKVLISERCGSTTPKTSIGQPSHCKITVSKDGLHKFFFIECRKGWESCRAQNNALFLTYID